MLQLELLRRQFLKISCKEEAELKKKNKTLSPLCVYTEFMDRQKELERSLCIFFKQLQGYKHEACGLSIESKWKKQR